MIPTRLLREDREETPEEEEECQKGVGRAKAMWDMKTEKRLLGMGDHRAGGGWGGRGGGETAKTNLV